MAVSINQVRAALLPEEPDYNKAAELGPEALPHLRALVRAPDVMLASKATYLASLIDHADAANVVKEAAQSGDAVVKVAAAAAAANLSGSDAAEVLVPLLSDADVGVRKTAVKSVPPDASNELRSALQQQGDREVHPQLRDLSGQTLNMLSSYRGWPRQASDPGFGSGDGGGTAGSRLQGAVDLLGAYGGGSGAGERTSSAAWEDREDGGGKIEHIAAGPTSSRADTSPDGGGEYGPQGIRDPAPSSGDGGGSLDASASESGSRRRRR